VNHSRGEYVRCEIYTNSIDSFWALLKRGIIGTYHKMSAPIPAALLNEFQFRFNNRETEDIFGVSDRRVLKRGNWRVLQSKQERAGEPIQLELQF
jgi:ISXO2-like transposase domain